MRLPYFQWPDMAILTTERSAEVIAGFLDQDESRFREGRRLLELSLNCMEQQLKEAAAGRAMMEAIRQAQMELPLQAD